jgi:hypothetical protein
MLFLESTVIARSFDIIPAERKLVAYREVLGSGHLVFIDAAN